MFTPNPTRCFGVVQERPREKKELAEPVAWCERLWFCPFYDDCLEAACLQGWRSFRCTECPVYRAARKTI